MSKSEYINSLRNYLYQLPQDEVNEIIADYEEHFHFAKESGKTDEEIIKKLGPAKSLAKLYITQAHIDEFYSKNDAAVATRVRGFLKAILAFILLAPINFLFAVGPFLAIIVTLITVWAVWVSLFAASFASYFGFLTANSPEVLGLFAHFSVFFFWIGALGVFALLGVFFYYISKVSLLGILSYIKWNIKVVLNKTKGQVS